MLRSWWLASFIGILTLSDPASAQSSNGTSKRGLTYQGTNHPADYNLFLSRNSTITWYYNWSPYPSLSQSRLSFAPMVHGTNQLDSDIHQVRSLGNKNVDILTFNEPDGPASTGGSNIIASAAAQAYINSILPLRSETNGVRISQPVVTQGDLSWLNLFNESCYQFNPSGGCTADFVALHWYGDFTGLASWLGTMRARHPTLPFWITEFSLPQATPEATLTMLNQSMVYLDGLNYVERYSWFGTFRTTAANNYTGANVALWDSEGGLTEIGSLYLGGAAKGFPVGAKSSAAQGSSPPSLGVGVYRGSSLWLALAVAVAIVCR